MIRPLLDTIRATLVDHGRHHGHVTDHYDGRRFFLPWDHTDRGFLDLLKWRFTGKSTPWPESVPDLPPDTPPARVGGDALRVSFIGHSTTLIQTAGVNILTDPAYSDRAGPFGIFGPKRVRRPGVPLDKLPPIDVVLVTHNHYDHMDLPALAALHARHRPRFLVPLGNGDALRRAAPGADVTELDWWECVGLAPGVIEPESRDPLTNREDSLTQGCPRAATPDIPSTGQSPGGTPPPEASKLAHVGSPDPLRIHCVPAHHWSARGLFDRRDALWCAFVIESPGGNVYFCGDSGYGDGVVFRMARERFGSLRLALLPIGAYEPRWFMSPAHMNPEEAVLAMKDLDAAQAAGLHHGVFKLTDEGIDQPLADLAAALAKHGVQSGNFPAPLPGEALIIP